MAEQDKNETPPFAYCGIDKCFQHARYGALCLDHEVERLRRALIECKEASSYTGSEEEIPRIVTEALADKEQDNE